MYTHIVIHYAEIGLKGDNRKYFENSLVNNIRSATKLDVRKIRGRIILHLPRKYDKQQLTKILQCIPGMSSFSFALSSSLDVEDIKQGTLYLATKTKFKSFKIKTIRSNKSYQLTSLQLNTILGDSFPDEIEVNLKNPDATFHIEITDKEAFIYTEKIYGVGGLPTGITGKVISLLSGGIDSPVASYFMMKRGCNVVFVHFHHHGKTGSKSKVKKLVQKLSKFQAHSKLYLIPFKELQLEITKIIPSKYRMIVYRRVMFQIAELIMKKEKARGFVTGDSLAQVASQTLENLNVIYSSTSFPIFSPLIGFDKQEIMDIARKLDTYDTSILPHEDCCSYLIDKHPETKGKLLPIENLEQNLDIKDATKKAIDNSEIILS